MELSAESRCTDRIEYGHLDHALFDFVINQRNLVHPWTKI